LTEYPQPREAQTEASGRLLGAPCNVSAIAHGGGRCATYVTASSLVRICIATISTAADTTTTEYGGISA